MTCLLGKLGIRLLCMDDAKGLWENMDLEGKESKTHTFSRHWKEKCMWGVMPRPVCLIWALGQVDHELIPTVQAPPSPSFGAGGIQPWKLNHGSVTCTFAVVNPDQEQKGKVIFNKNICFID